MKTPQDTAGFRRILIRNVALPLGLALTGAVLFIGLVAYLLTAIGWVEHTDRVLARAYALQKADLEMESSVRGFLLSGREDYLESYEKGLSSLQSDVQRLKEMVADNPAQVDRLSAIQGLQQRWNAYAAESVARRRTEPTASVTPGQGKVLKDRIRESYDVFVATEQRLRQERTTTVNRNTWLCVLAFAGFMLGVGGLLAWRGRRDLLGLSGTFMAMLDAQQQQSQTLQAQAWLREGQSRLSEQLASHRDLDTVARAALEFFSHYLGASVAAAYVAQEEGFTRAATWGWPASGKDERQDLSADRTLVAECALQRRLIALNEVPADYLRVSSALGHTTAQSVLLAPVVHEGRLIGVVELGFLRALAERDSDLLSACSSVLGGALEAARYRRRLQDILEETQQLNEELQVQQEELRTANEELEEQSRALRESQAQMETQQAELEQTNVQLSDLASRMSEQRDQLQETQGELQARASDLQRASRYKSEFLANMSHELRTPLNSVLILARLLADNPTGQLSAEQIKFAESIYNAGNDLLTLINDILDISKVEAGKLDVRPEPTPVAQLAASLRTMFEPQAARKGLALDIQIADDVAPVLFTDRQRLEQILKNLLSNALKFTDQGGVTLQITERAAGLVAFEVRDTGIGIDPGQHDLIFQAFQQADGTASRRYGGTGLGLSISRDLARLLGGSIAVASFPGQGSTFTLVVPEDYRPPAAEPVAREAAATRSHPSPAAPANPDMPAARTQPVAPLPFADDRAEPAGGRRSVLVVEDDPAFARILLDLARELNYHCVVAQQAEEGLRLAEQLQPDAVLLDMRLPDGSGLSVLQRLKENPRTRHVPVHVISVEDQSETALQMGAIGYAVKPATRDQLREVFTRLESKLSQKLKRVLVVEDDVRQRESVSRLISDGDVEITAVGRGEEALALLQKSVFDCMVIDLQLPDMTGQELLRQMASGESRSFPPVIVYTGRNLTRDEEAQLLRYSHSIIIKGARSPERLLDEVTLFLHKVESQLSTERQGMLRTARSRDKVFEGRRILVVDDDVRNIFALASALEQKGAQVEMARSGVEALEKLAGSDDIDLVLMDVMMPEMDGYTAMREIRRNTRWHKLPIIAVTAKAMKDDQAKCLAAGASDYLAKPIELDRLFSLLRVWMPKLERI